MFLDREEVGQGLGGVSALRRRLPRAAGSGTPSLSGYGVTQPMEPTGKSLPVEVAVKPNVTLPSGGMVRL